jgi:UDP-glucose 4-epimerase
MGHIIEHASEQARPVHTYNLGTKTTTAVDEIAEIVCDVVGVGPT